MPDHQHPSFPDPRNRVALLADAQSFTAWEKEGVKYPRVRYGEEDEDCGAQEGKPCKDCGALPGQYHALGCEVEQCPLCRWLALECEHNLYDSED